MIDIGWQCQIEAIYKVEKKTIHIFCYCAKLTNYSKCFIRWKSIKIVTTAVFGHYSRSFCFIKVHSQSEIECSLQNSVRYHGYRFAISRITKHIYILYETLLISVWYNGNPFENSCLNTLVLSKGNWINGAVYINKALTHYALYLPRGNQFGLYIIVCIQCFVLWVIHREVGKFVIILHTNLSYILVHSFDLPFILRVDLHRINHGEMACTCLWISGESTA